jgi:hypothetical protein
MARKGLNATLSYVDGGGTTHTYRVRVADIGHGVDMIYTESKARTERAFYPHRAAEQQFALTVLLKDWAERTHFTNWLADYASFAIDPDNSSATFPWMSCSVPSREFARKGVPLAGYEWGAHTGMMMFTPQILFAAATTPGQKGQPDISSVINKWGAFASDPAIQYFYPIGTQLSGNAAPANYAQIQWPQDPSQFDQQPSTPVTPVPSPTAPGQTTTPIGVSGS